ncbi:hypothetical protein OGAPHI_004257 [Ogataea philodendri]|uniref:Uncharacterized protein n=1 Tax=Ogataea philodendri TaxID=1378263 RepID=A0A9P8P589_9ASCO|nr:uncharacterized protein OGAPHI_004257 [Ogataea philodendri]KAH3666068.1 hypothetical protein OGAPHI_004257 [Ogataea philodendri]
MSESTPLLPTQGSSSKRSKWRALRLDVYIPIIIICTFFLTAAITFTARVKPQLGDLVAQGTRFESDEVKFLGVDDDSGLILQVKGTNFNNYTQIEDPVGRFYFKVAGFTVRKLNLAVDELNLVVFDESKGDYKNLGVAEIAPFPVKITDKTESHLSLYMKVFPKADGVLGVIKRVLLSHDAKLRLKGDANVKVLVLNGYIPVSNLVIPLDLLIN